MADCIGHKGMEIITIDSSDDDSILRVVTPREVKANRRSDDTSSSSESSHDSIWDKGISAPRLSQRSENQVSRSPRLGKYIASNGNEANDLCDDSDESSSLSSNDSIWNRVGTLSIGHNNESQVKLDEVDTDLPLRKDVANSKTRDDETNLTAIFDNDLVSVDSSHEKQHEQSISDGSSISSSDSILKNTFFARKKEQSIHSYYDYCKYYRKSSTGAQEKTISQVTSSHTSISAIDTNFRINKVLSPSDAQWKIVLLMDHREFGCSNNFLQQVETQINNHFGGKHAEITTLPSADYLYVARLISTSANNFGEILDERVLDVAIERKAVQDVCQCLIADSKKYHPLSFFEAQMYKLMNCGMSKKLFLMEGDEDTSKRLMYGAKSIEERKKRLKRVKTLRLQLANGEFEGVKLICTRSRRDTIKFLIHQLKCFKDSFDPSCPPLKTREQLKKYINRQMQSPTFLEYLRLRSIPSIGDIKAMKVITDPNLNWDKNFVSPASSKKSKASLDDKATFWIATLPKGKTSANE